MSTEPLDIEQWNTYAELYHKGKGSEGDSFHQDLIQPILDIFLENLAEETILDAGCGNGFLTNILAKTATHVTGIDSSRELLTFTNKFTLPNVSFMQGDLTENLPFTEGQFTMITSVMVLQYVENIEMFIKECARVLAPSGTLIVIIDHPSHALFHRAQQLAGKKDDKFLSSDSYFKTGARKKNSLWGKATLQYYHRPVSFYINSFLNHFELVSTEEKMDRTGEIPKILGLKFKRRQ